jgi:hypothetical protein
MTSAALAPAPLPCWHMDGPCPEDQCERTDTTEYPGVRGRWCPEHVPYTARPCCRLCRRPA